MKVVIAHRTGQAKVVELPEPALGARCISLRVSHSAMRLPEELAQIEEASLRTPPGQDGFPIGSCASGTIVAVGEGVRRLKAGLRVAVSGIPYVYHASHLVVPETLAIELPKKVNHEEGAYAGQGAIAMHLVRTAQLQLGEVAVVHGADMIGLLTAQIIRAAGCQVILIDDSEHRLNKARAVGIPFTFLPDDEQTLRTIDTLTEGNGVDAVILTRSGSGVAFRSGCEYLRDNGIMVLGAPLGTEVALDLVRNKGLRLRAAVGGGPEAGDSDYERLGVGYPRHLARWTTRENMACFCNLLSERRVQISPLVTDRTPIERAGLAYEKALRGRESVLGCVLTV